MGSTRPLLVLVLSGALAFAGAGADRYHPAPAARSGDRYHPARARSGAGESTAAHWYGEAAAGVAARAARGAAAGAGRARNVVMFLGDGMSVPTLAAARTLLGQRRGAAGEEAQLSFEAFPTVGLAKTYCVNAQIPDSACTATAYLSGVKTNRGVLGVTAAVTRGDCAAARDPALQVPSLAEWALADGRDAGIVTTTRVTHASPAGAFAKSAERGWENDDQVRAAGLDPALCPDLALQLLRAAPGDRFKVILGGGRRNFLPNSTADEEGTRGQRADGRDLIAEWRADKAARNLSHAYVWHARELRDLAAAPPDYLLGLFEGSHLQYNMEGDPEAEPSLTELTEVAIRSLARNPRGFFLFVEGGRIDHAHHDNWPRLALDETIELSNAVQRARDLLDPDDSLIVVTSDHSHVMTINGYSRRGNEILGFSDDIGDDGVPYMTLSYANGPGARTHTAGVRPDVTRDENIESSRWRTHAEVPLESETHGGDDVGVFALGAGHEMFSGLYEQSQIPHLMAYSACLGPGARAPACSAAPPSSPSGAARAALLAAPLALLALVVRRSN